MKTISGILKLLYPHGEINEEELAEALSYAIEGRQRIRNQLQNIAPGEYHPIKIGAKLSKNGQAIVPTLLDADRKQRITRTDLFRHVNACERVEYTNERRLFG